MLAPYGLLFILIGLTFLVACARRIISRQGSPATSRSTTFVGAAGFCFLIAGCIGMIGSAGKFESANHKTFACQTNLKAMGRALAEYMQDWNETLPPAKDWFNASSQYIAGGVTGVTALTAPHCPATQAKYSYAFNENLGGKAGKDIYEPKETAMLFECDALDANAYGGKAMLSPARHNGKWNLLFQYGFARNRDAKEMEQLKWNIGK